MPDISQEQAEAIQQLTNGVYLEVKEFFDCFREENFNFKEGVHKYKSHQREDLNIPKRKFIEEKFETRDTQNQLIQKKKRIFQANFFSLLVSIKSGTPVSKASLKYMDKFLMFYKEEGNQYKIFARNQVSFEMLMKFSHKKISQMNTQMLIDLILVLEKLNPNLSTKRSFFKKLLLKCLCNVNEGIKIENIALRGIAGNNEKNINILFKDLPKIIGFNKFDVPTNCDKNINYLFIPEHFNYPLFDFFLVTKIDGYAEPCLICCRATIQSISDQSKRDMESDTEKQAAALQWYNFYKENKLGKIIEVYFTSEREDCPEPLTVASFEDISVNGVCLYNQCIKVISFFGLD
jgi:hypothetical protein